MKPLHIIVCFLIAKNKRKYWFIGQSEKSMKAQSWKRGIIYSIFPSINTSFFPKFFPSFHLHHRYQTMDVKPLFSIIYFSILFQKYKVTKESDQTSCSFSLVGQRIILVRPQCLKLPQIAPHLNHGFKWLYILYMIVHTSYD